MVPRSTSGSDGHSNHGYGDSADARYVTQPPYSFANLQTQPYQYPIHRYMGNVEDGRIQAVSASASSFPARADSVPRVFERRGSETASVTATVGSSRTSTWGSVASSSDVPPLSTSSTAPSTISEDDSESSPTHRYHLPDEDSGDEVKETVLQCPYGVLGCRKTTTDYGAFEMHCKSHFRGNLPKWADCPFASCEWSITESSGDLAWNARARHIRSHRSQGETAVRPVASRHEHILHLWRLGLVSTGEQQHLRRGIALESAPALMQAAGAERTPERERLRAARRAAVARDPRGRQDREGY
ncbi:hypothetical protein LTR86_007464 [Recurvomyces mirabilis]|nr:hypothetical protein LTR86_007464 [Recurvomyces mirabilis]